MLDNILLTCVDTKTSLLCLSSPVVQRHRPLGAQCVLRWWPCQSLATPLTMVAMAFGFVPERHPSRLMSWTVHLVPPPLVASSSGPAALASDTHRRDLSLLVGYSPCNPLSQCTWPLTTPVSSGGLGALSPNLRPGRNDLGASCPMTTCGMAGKTASLPGVCTLLMSTRSRAMSQTKW